MLDYWTSNFVCFFMLLFPRGFFNITPKLVEVTWVDLFYFIFIFFNWFFFNLVFYRLVYLWVSLYYFIQLTLYEVTSNLQLDHKFDMLTHVSFFTFSFSISHSVFGFLASELQFNFSLNKVIIFLFNFCFVTR